MWSIEWNRFFFLISLQKRTPFFGRQSVRLTRAYAYDKKYIRFNHMLRNERKKRSTKGKNISQYFYFAVAINVKVISTYIHISSSLFYSVVHVIRKMCNFDIHFADTPSIDGTNYSVNIIEWLQNEKNGLFTYLFYKLNIHIHTKSTICWNYKKAQRNMDLLNSTCTQESSSTV